MRYFKRKNKTGVIILLVGKSGTGKSTLCDYLNKYENWKVLKSYTTRPVRNNDPSDINTHTFISKDEFDKLKNKCAYTKFDNYEYCATSKQVNESDIYIIDPKGVKYFREHYNGTKQPIVVYMFGKDDILKAHMLERGDNEESIESRIKNDEIEFNKFFDYNYMLPLSSLHTEASWLVNVRNREEMKLAERKLP
jgi:guanylate kinase